MKLLMTKISMILMVDLGKYVLSLVRATCHYMEAKPCKITSIYGGRPE